MRSMHAFWREGGRAVLPLCVIVLVVLGSACGGGGGGEARAESAGDIVARAATETAAEKRFHFVFDEENGPKSTLGVHLVFAEGDVAVPDRVKADVSGTFLGIPLHSQLVVANGKTYIEDPLSGKWRQVDIKTNPVGFFDPKTGVVAVIRGADKLELIGSEKIGGVDAYHVKGQTTVGAISPLLGNPPGTEPVDLELWVDKKTDRLVRLRLTGHVEEGDGDDAVRTIELSRFGVVVPLTAPTEG